MDDRYRYYVIDTGGDLYRWRVQDTVTGERTRDRDGFSARFLTEDEARASVPAAETDPDYATGNG